MVFVTGQFEGCLEFGDRYRDFSGLKKCDLIYHLTFSASLAMWVKSFDCNLRINLKDSKFDVHGQFHRVL